MNELLNNSGASVEFPDVSGAEHLQMLRTRDKIAEIESTLTEEEKIVLATGDRLLIEQAARFYAELFRFVDLAKRRHSENIPPRYWWWYLDVLVSLPKSLFLKDRDSTAYRTNLTQSMS